MSKIVLNDITSLNAVSVLNDNFDKVEAALNDNALYRNNIEGEPNSMSSDLDMNGKRLYNLPAPALDSEAARLKDIRDIVAGDFSGLGVTSFNGATGDVSLTAGGLNTIYGYTPAPTASPALTGNPTAPTQTAGNNSTRLATTAFVTAAVSAASGAVTSVNGRTGVVSIGSSDVTGALGYTPANIASPTFTGVPSGPTASGGTNTTQLATTAFVTAAVTASTTGVSSFNTRTGAVTLSSGDVTTALGFTPANIASPAFTGNPTAATQSGSDNSTRIATTAFVKGLISGAGVSSYNTRTGAVTSARSDIITPITSDANTLNLIWNSGVAGAVNANSNSNIYVQRNASYTGGTAGDVKSALYVETYTPTNHSSYEWGITSVVYSNSANVGGGGAAAVPQNVAINGTVWKRGTAPVWAGNFAAYQDIAGTYSTTYGTIHGVEINVGIDGGDTGQNTLGVLLAPQAVHGASVAKPWAGMWVSGSGNINWNVGIYAQGGEIFGYQDVGSHAVAIDLSGSTNSTSALRIKANDYIDLEATSAIRMKYNSSTGYVEFYNGSSRKGYINMSSSDAQMNISSANFVDIASAQTVTGAKTFSGINWFQALLYCTGGVHVGSQTIKFNSAGNYSSTAGSASGFMRILVDDVTYLVPIYSQAGAVFGP